MHLADLTSPSARIHSALNDLLLAWERATETWNDGNARRLEEEWLKPLGMTVRIGLDAANRMNEVLAEAGRQVE